MGTYQTSFYKLVDKIINKLKNNGFKQVSYGSLQELDMERQNDYPLAHLVFPNGTNDEKTTTLNFTLIVADKCDNTGNEYLEYGKDNTIDIQQDLLVRAQTTIKMLDKRYSTTYDSIEVGYDLNYDMTFTAFKEDTPNLITGFIFNINISFPNMYADLICSDTGEITAVGGVPYSSSSGIKTYSVPIMAGGITPTDNNVYFFGNIVVAPGSFNWNLKKFGVVKSGTIISVLIDVVPQSNQGSGEPWSMYLYVNRNGVSQAQELDEEYLIDTISTTGYRKWLNEGLSIPITTNDLLYFKWVCPAWATNPVSCYLSGQILIEY
jgi:hypothetical protein